MSDFTMLRARLDAMAPLPETEWQRLLPLLSRRTLEAGDLFIRAGEVSSLIGFLTEGTLKYFANVEGREFVRHFCFGGHFVSTSVVPTAVTASPYSVQALERSHLITFGYHDWLALLSRHTVWGRIAQVVLEESQARNERRERSLAVEDATQRYLGCLEEFPGIEGRVKQYDIASYLGITPVALSRLRGRTKN